MAQSKKSIRRKFKCHEKQRICFCHLPTITKFNGVLFPQFIITLRFNGTLLQQKASDRWIQCMSNYSSFITTRKNEETQQRNQ